MVAAPHRRDEHGMITLWILGLTISVFTSKYRTNSGIFSVSSVYM